MCLSFSLHCLTMPQAVEDPHHGCFMCAPQKASQCHRSTAIPPMPASHRGSEVAIPCSPLEVAVEDFLCTPQVLRDLPLHGLSTLLVRVNYGQHRAGMSGLPCCPEECPVPSSLLPEGCSGPLALLPLGMPWAPVCSPLAHSPEGCSVSSSPEGCPGPGRVPWRAAPVPTLRGCPTHPARRGAAHPRRSGSG